MATNPHNRLGLHYFPDEAHYAPQDLQFWLPQLQALGAAWLVLRAGVEQLIPEAFIRGLLEAGIEPVVWIHAPVSSLRAKDLAPALNAYHRWGAQYVVPGDRPNQRLSWSAGDWSRSGLVERSVDRLLPLWQLQRAIGLRPVFPPLEPGGDYWDTAFLETAIRVLMRRGQHDLVREMSLAIYGWTFGRSLDWGAGGPERWPGSTPYAPAESSPDQRGIRLSDWYEAILSETFGQALPMLVVAGGALRGAIGRKFQEEYPLQTAALYRMFSGADAPANVACYAFYLLATATADRDAPFAWFDSSGEARPVAAAVQALRPRNDVAAVPSAPAKTLEHYVLLGEGSAAALARGLRQLGGMAMEQRAVIGFSSEQARMAKHVTILGSEQSVPAWIEHGLRQHGCQVTRVSAVGAESRSQTSESAPYHAQE